MLRVRNASTARMPWLGAAALAGALLLLAACVLPAPVAQPAATAAPAEEAVEAAPTAMTGEVPVTSTGDPVAGEYIFHAAEGCGCHMNHDLGGLAGGNKFEGPFGVVYSANLTPDPATGIGSLTDQEVADAIRFAKRPDGARLAVMPPRFTLSDKDVIDLVAYLRSQPAIENAVTPRELTTEPEPFVVDTPPPAEAPTDPVGRGGYLVALARCARCHTPTNEDGSSQEGMFLAGATVLGIVAPNLTPDHETGLGHWTDQQIADLLATGIHPDGSTVGEDMRGTIDRITSHLTDEDRLAIAAYLRSLPPVENLDIAHDH